MPKKRLLLTGDDGYNSLGIRLLIHFLRDDFDLTVVGTKDQQSAVGGMIHVREGCSFGETKLEGIRALWVEGSPGDAMELSHSFFAEPFDYVISGINQGENVGNAVVSSGTVCAAVRSLVLNVAPRAIAISWSTPPEFYFRKHRVEDSIEEFLAHPGKAATKAVRLAIEADNFGARMLNINIPRGVPKGVVFARPSETVDECYPPITIDRDNGRFKYPIVELERKSQNLTKDVEAMAAGFVTLTPMNADWTDETLFAKLSREKLQWE